MKRAFTIVEVVVVIMIVGILCAIILPNMGEVTSRASSRSALTDAQNTLTSYLSLNYEYLADEVVVFSHKDDDYYAYTYKRTVEPGQTVESSTLVPDEGNPYNGYEGMTFDQIITGSLFTALGKDVNEFSDVTRLIKSLPDGVRIYAKFSGHAPINFMYVKYMPGALNVENLPGNSVVEGGDVITVAPAPTRQDYVFLYWLYNGTARTFNPGETLTVNEDVTLTAYWRYDGAERPQYTLTYAPGAENVTNMPTNYVNTYYSESQVYVSEVQPVRPGYTFTGWEANFNGQVYRDPFEGAYLPEEEMSFIMPERDVVLTAKWNTPRDAQNTFTLIYDDNVTDGSVSGMPTTMTRTEEGDTYWESVSGTIPVRDGYVFRGWGDAPVHPEKVYRIPDIDSAKNIELHANMPTTLYAQWAEKVVILSEGIWDRYNQEFIRVDLTDPLTGEIRTFVLNERYTIVEMKPGAVDTEDPASYQKTQDYYVHLGISEYCGNYGERFRDVEETPGAAVVQYRAITTAYGLCHISEKAGDIAAKKYVTIHHSDGSVEENVTQYIAQADHRSDYGSSWFADQDLYGDLSGHYYLSRDIDFESAKHTSATGRAEWGLWALLATRSSTPFTGVFDGGGHIIRKMKIDANVTHSAYVGGLFCWASNSDGDLAVIKNIGIANMEAKPGNCYMGTIVAKGGDEGNGNLTIDNCYASGWIQASAGMVGGIVGQMEGTIRISNCVNYCDISTNCNHSAGGIIGAVGEGDNPEVYIDNCVNFGDIDAKNRVGGITGGIYLTDTKPDKFSITNCENYGNIIATGHVGGIVGYLLPDIEDIASGLIEDCVNYGDVTSNGNIGGIAGEIRYARISRCANLGTITRLDNGDAGGIIGTAAVIEMTHVFNMGNLNSTDNEDFSGIIGDLLDTDEYDGSYISGCFNTGYINYSVSGTVYPIIGNGINSSRSTLDKSYYLSGSSCKGYSGNSSEYLNLSDDGNYKDYFYMILTQEVRQGGLDPNVFSWKNLDDVGPHGFDAANYYPAAYSNGRNLTKVPWINTMGIDASVGDEMFVVKSISVSKLDINAALNDQGQGLMFTTGANSVIYDPTYGYGGPIEAPWTLCTFDYPERLCAISGNQGMNSTVSWIETEVFLNAGEKLSFDWNLSCEPLWATTDSGPSGEIMRFFVNGEVEEKFNTTSSATSTGWSTFIYDVPTTGNYTFRWYFVKDGGTAVGLDSAFLDNVYVMGR